MTMNTTIYKDAPTAIHEMQTLITSLQAPLKNLAAKFIGSAYFTNTLAQLQSITQQLTTLSTPKCILQHVDMSSCFVYFPKLPTELREMIWHFALPAQQILEVGYKDSGSRHSLRGQVKDIKNHILPSNLHVCHESRALAMRWYQRNVGANESQQPFIGYNDHNDIIYLSCNDGSDNSYRYRWCGLRHIATIIPGSNIQHVALDTRMFRQWVMNRRIVHDYLQSLPNLKTVTIVVHAHVDPKNGLKTCRSTTWRKERGLPTFARIEDAKINDIYYNKAKKTFTKIEWRCEGDEHGVGSQGDGTVELRIRQCLRNGVPCCVVGEKPKGRN